ncbi:hypothetical protein ACE6H2_000651 [Prunus campanulata]
MFTEYFHKIDRFVYQEENKRIRILGTTINQPCRPFVGLPYQLLFCLKRHLLFFFF